MKNSKLSLSVLPQKLAICRLDKDTQIPSWVEGDDFFSVTKTDDELSIVCSENLVPSDIKTEKDWRAFKVAGPLDFSLTGILASLANPLAAVGISIFAVSTFDTDYLLVKSDKLDEAVRVLSSFCNIQN
ncbi:amino acid-binding protein [Microgenomates group bacterium RIFCSPLOWO2_01_FULL_46_13]|nr:MAG: amino acid-binding protein [Microgenomates group bacterium RIFCSPHIGHO2_01_FULL_45_11]OGV95054.1 MAG: amino acid-binding protein [Microgenomates group bacterium RIFCSPLOWO2_01_FULL_46_13]